MPNFNKLRAFLIWAIGKYFKIFQVILDIKIKISIFKTSNVPNFDKFNKNKFFDIKIDIGMFKVSSVPYFNKF